MGNFLDGLLEEDMSVGHFESFSILHVDLMLAAAPFAFTAFHMWNAVKANGAAASMRSTWSMLKLSKWPTDMSSSSRPSRKLPTAVGNFLDGLLEEDMSVGHFESFSILHVDLMLAAAPFAFTAFHRDA